MELPRWNAQREGRSDSGRLLSLKVSSAEAVGTAGLPSDLGGGDCKQMSFVICLGKKKNLKSFVFLPLNIFIFPE